MSAAPGDLVSLKWEGESVQAIANQWVLRATSPDMDLSALTGQISAAGFQVVGAERIGQSSFARLTTIGAEADDLALWAEVYAPQVDYIEPNLAWQVDDWATAITPNDPSFSSLWGLNNTGQTGGTVDADIDAPEAWEITTGSDQVVIGIVDTGVDYTHPDLAGNMWRNPGEVAGDGVDNDHNGYVDDVYGYDFAGGDSDPMDNQGHGTHVAGTIGAVGQNGTGVTGINWNVQLMALNVSSSGGWITYDDAIEGLEYAAMMKQTYGVNLVALNNSWGGEGWHQGLADAFAAVNSAGIMAVAAAANGGDDAVGDDIDRSPVYPGSYDYANLITVAATDDRDRLTSWSNYGEVSVDLAAPGDDITSTMPGGGYGSMSGTSMATPHVTGVVALLAAANPSATPAEIKAALLAGVDPLAGLAGKVASGGRLNAYGALEAIGGDTNPALRVTGMTPSHAAEPTDTVTIYFSADLLNTSVVPGNFELRDNGADNTFGTSDDTVYSVSASETRAGTVQLSLASELGEENYRLTIRGTGSNPIRDTQGSQLNGGQDEQRTFTIESQVDPDPDPDPEPDPGTPGEPNDTIAQAVDSGLTANSSVSLSGNLGNGAYPYSDVDMVRVDAQAGDTLTADIDAEVNYTGLDSYLRLFDAWGNELDENDDDGSTYDSYLTFTAGSGGAYYVGVSGYGNSNYSPTVAGSGTNGSTGNYELTLTLDRSDPGPDPDPDPDPDADGYQADAVSYTFEDIAATGQAGIARGADDQYFLLDAGELAGFDFSFFGRAVDEIYISSNGLVTFDRPSTTYRNGDLTSSPSGAALAAFWDDLVVDGSSSSAVLWERRGSGSSERLILQWNQVQFYGGSGAGTVTFQAVLFEQTGVIQLNYRDLSANTSGSEADSATVGVKAAGTVAPGDGLVRLAYNNGPNTYVGTGRSTRLTPTGEDNTPAPAEPVRLLTPSGTQTVERGETVAIEWSGGDDQTTMHLWVFGPSGWEILAADRPAKDGAYEWDITGADLGWYSVGAHVFDGTEWYSTSSPGTVHITSTSNSRPTVTATAPAQNVELERGEDVTVRWQADDGDGDALRATVWAYSSATGWFTVAADLDAAAGSYVWDTSSATPDWYSLSVWVTDGTTWVGDTAPGQVHVVLATTAQPMIELAVPDSGSWRMAGQTVDLYWSAEVPTGTVMEVYLWAQDASGYWHRLNQTGLDATVGHYRWNTSGYAPGTYTFGATLAGDGDLWTSVVSDAWIRVF